jgi:hypothetical protein
MLPAIALSAWLVTLSLQFADIGTARFDARRLARGARTLVRLHPVAWVIPIAGVVLVVLGLGVEYTARLLLDDGEPLLAVVAGLGVATALGAAWLIITAAATRPAADSYRAIRDELVDMAGVRVPQERLDELRVRLVAIDDDAALPAPVFISSMRSAMGWVFRRPQRLVPPLTAVFLLVTVIVAAVGDPGSGWLVAAAIAAVVLSAVLAVTGARASLTLLVAVRDTQVEYRAEVVHLLSEAEKISKKRVAGLGDRVARALQILREQQG